MPEHPDLPDLPDLLLGADLDDPSWAPSPALRAGAVRRGRALRRRRRLAGGSAALACSLVVAMAAAGSMAQRNLDRVERVDIAAVGPDGAPEVVDPASPQILVLAGVDTDEGLAAEGGVEDPARVATARSDTIVVARLDPAAGTLAILPLPRDLWGAIPGEAPGRINAALPTGGPDLLVETIEARLGVEVDHYLQTDFAGAVAIGDALGGVRIDVPAPLRDRRTGLDLPAGCQVVRGPQLLALGRARHLEVRRGGTWVLDPTSDLGRIERQQALAASVLAAMTELGSADPVELFGLTDAVADHLTVDSTLTSARLRGLVAALQDLEVVSLRLPVVDAYRDGAAVLDLAPGAEQVVDGFRRGAAPADAGPSSSVPGSGPAPVVPQPC